MTQEQPKQPNTKAEYSTISVLLDRETEALLTVEGLKQKTHTGIVAERIIMKFLNDRATDGDLQTAAGLLAIWAKQGKP